MNKNIKKLVMTFMVMALILPVSLSFKTKAEEPNQTTENEGYRLPIFGTTDVHGAMAYDIDAEDETEIKYRLSWISDKIHDTRGYGDDERKDLAVVLDGGDIYQGEIQSGYFKGKAISSVYNMMGYDAVTVGNHEFDWHLYNVIDPDGTMVDYEVGDHKGENKTPVVICNLFRYDEKLPGVEDYIILDKTAVDSEGHELSVKIGVIGMAGNYADSIRSFVYDGDGYKIDVDYDKVNQIARELEESGECDATILLAHEVPLKAADGLGDDSVIDLVLGGHDHKMVNGVNENGIRYMEPLSYGRGFSYAEMVFSVDEGQPVYEDLGVAEIRNTSKDGNELRNLPENADELDKDVLNETDYILNILDDDLGTEIGYITESARRLDKIPGSGKRASTADNWLMSIIQRQTGADVVFSNGARDEFLIPEGQDRRTITLGDIYSMFLFENSIYTYEITYEELLQAFEYSFNKRGQYLLAREYGVFCHFNGFTIVSLETKDGEEIYSDGVWKDGWKEKKLKVSVNDYIATDERPTEEGISNPFYAWTDTDRLICTEPTDLECGLNVLPDEAEENDGLLFVDPVPYYICDDTEVKEAPKAKKLTYKGSMQELVTKGKAIGDMFYALGEDSENAPEFDGDLESADKKWNMTIPEAMDAGTYYVWYLAKEYKNGKTMTDPECVEVTIKKAAQKITASDLSLKIGESGKINAKTSGDGALSYKISSGDSIKLDKKGNVKAVKSGNTVITINASETANYKAASKNIKAVVNAEEVVDMLRLYNPNSGEHFYTASEAEKDNLVKEGWGYEGLAWKSPKKSKTPVYRLYNPNAGDHHYTVSASEKDNLIKAGWNYEGIGWYSDDAKSKAVYRAYNPNAIAGAHHFTASKAEIEDIVKLGWKDEGIAFYSK